MPLGRGVVRQNDAVDLTVVMNRYKCLKRSLDLVFAAGDNGVSQTVAAGIAVEFGLCRLPAGIPDGIPVFNIVITSAVIERTVIVAISG